MKENTNLSVKDEVKPSFYKDLKLISMIDFVFMLRNRTTSELVTDFPNNFKKPIWNGNQTDMVKDMLVNDAIQWKLTGEYAKFCKRPLHKNQFDQNDKENCLFKGDWKIKKDSNTSFESVYNQDIQINLDTLEGFKYYEVGCLDFKLAGNTIGQLADVVQGIVLTELATKQIFGYH
jgi:hypothetical protein